MGAAVFGLYALILGALSIKHVSYGLLALICMFALEQWGAIYIPFVAQNGTLVNVAVLSLVAFAWFRLPAGSTFEFIKYPTRTLFILFLVYVFVTTLWSPDDVEATTLYFNQLHYLVAALVIAPLLIRKPQDFSRVLDGVVWVGGSLVILFAYIPDFDGRSLLVEYNLEETLSLPLALGDFAGFVMLIAVMRLRASLIPAIWGLAVAGSALYLITKTGSRGQLLFALASLIICIPVRWKRFTVSRIVAILLVVLLAAGAVFVVLNTENTLSSRMSGDDGSAFGTMQRVEMSRILMDAWFADPSAMLFGLGSSASYSRDLIGLYPHVVPIEILGELGLFGFVFFSIAVLSLFLQAFTGSHRKSLNQVDLNNFAGLFACLVFAILLSCKQGSLLFSSSIFMYAALAEKCLVLSMPAKNRKKRKARKPMLSRSQTALR